MSTTATAPVPGTPPDFDSRAFIDARNRGETPKAPDKPAEPEKKPEVIDEPKAASSRSQRRALNSAMREAAEERGRRLAIEEMLAKGTLTAPKAAPDADAEPQRAQFPAGDEGMAQFLRATQKWDRAQEAKTQGTAQDQTKQQEQFTAHLRAMDEKCEADVLTIPDWEKVHKAASEDEDAPEFSADEHPVFMGALARSDVRAFLLYHFAKHPDELQKMLDLTKSPDRQISAFHRLEGRLEKEYSKPQAAQASEAEKPKEDRKHPAEAAKPGGTATGDSTPVKPKPSSEVAARGGTPAPDEPAIGSPAWMLMRNQIQYGWKP